MAERENNVEFDVTPTGIGSLENSGSYNLFDAVNRVLLNINEVNRRLDAMMERLQDINKMLTPRRNYDEWP